MISSEGEEMELWVEQRTAVLNVKRRTSQLITKESATVRRVHPRKYC